MANKREARRNNVHPVFPPAALTSLKLSFLLRHALRQTASGGLKAEAGEWIKVAVKYLFQWGLNSGGGRVDQGSSKVHNLGRHHGAAKETYYRRKNCESEV